MKLVVNALKTLNPFVPNNLKVQCRPQTERELSLTISLESDLHGILWVLSSMDLQFCGDQSWIQSQ